MAAMSGCHNSSYCCNINSLRAFRSILYLKFYRLPLSESLKTLILDACVMYKYIISILSGQKPIPLFLIKPFHSSFNHT